MVDVSTYNGTKITIQKSPQTFSYNLRRIVSVPPRWLVEPVDVSVERNRHVALHCQAQGVPAPTITWKKATGL